MKKKSIQLCSGQKGLAPIASILIGVIILGTIGYLLISKNNTKDNPFSQLNLKSKALNANCDLKDPDLCKYVNNAMSGNDFKNGMVMKTVTTDADNKKSESIFEIDGKGNSRMISYQDNKETMGMVNLGNFTYMKDLTDGTWWKYESKTQNSDLQTHNPVDAKQQMKKYAEEFSDKTSYKKIGKEPCGSLLCFKYQMILTDMPDYTQYLYFDDREYMMRKTRTEDKSKMITETSYEYKSVMIQEPQPVKEGNPWGGVTNDNPPRDGSGISQEELKKIQEEIQGQAQQQEEITQTEE